MTEQEEINVEVQRKLALQDAKLNQFMDEMKDFKNEMRQQNQMRAAEISQLRADMNMQVADIRNSMNAMGKHVRNLTIAAMVGVGAMALSIIFAVVFK